MPELQLTYSELIRRLKAQAGLDRSGASLSSFQSDDIENILTSGLRSFYYPALPNGSTHKWSFLEVSLSIDLTIGQSVYILPIDFSALTETFMYSDGSKKRPMDIVSDKQMRSLLSNLNETGTPRSVAIRSRGVDLAFHQRWEAMFYPVPDEALSVTGRMEIEPLANTSAETNLPGGAMHSETILEACLASVEKLFNPEAGPGIHAAKFAELLQASVARDTQMSIAEESIWPEDDDNLLTINKSKLDRLIGNEMFSSPHPGAWSSAQAAKVREVRRAGMRQFYHPRPLPGERLPHRWSFLSPVARVEIVSGKTSYNLPRDFSMVTGNIVFAPENGVTYPPLSYTSSDMVEEMLQTNFTSTYPIAVATRARRSNSITGTQWELLVAPIPSASKTLLVPYLCNPDNLADDADLPLGGQPHAQTLIESCLAAAEVFETRKGPHQDLFISCLIGSVGHDRLAGMSKTFGYSSDNTERYSTGNSSFTDFSEVAYNFNGATVNGSAL